MIKEKFTQFAKSKNVKLHKGQRQIVDVILEQISNDDHFLLSRRSGKTLLFKLMDEFFSSIEISNPQNLVLTDKDRHPPKCASIMSAH